MSNTIYNKNIRSNYNQEPLQQHQQQQQQQRPRPRPRPRPIPAPRQQQQLSDPRPAQISTERQVNPPQARPRSNRSLGLAGGSRKLKRKSKRLSKNNKKSKRLPKNNKKSKRLSKNNKRKTKNL